MKTDQSNEEIREIRANILSLAAIFKAIWAGRVLMLRALVGMWLLATAILFFATPTYTGHIILAPNSFGDSQSPSPFSALGNMSGLSSLAGLANVSLGSSSPASFTQFRESLTTVPVARHLEDQADVLKRIFPNSWSREKNEWVRPKSILGQIKFVLYRVFGRSSWHKPNSSDLAEYLNDNLRIRELADGMYLKIEFSHEDPELIGQLLSNIHVVADELIRSEMVAQSEVRLQYLQQELKTTTTMEQKESLIELMSQQLTTQMLAAVDKHYVTKVVEPTRVSIDPTWPAIPQVYVVFFILGLLIGLAFILLWSIFDRPFPTLFLIRPNSVKVVDSKKTDP